MTDNAWYFIAVTVKSDGMRLLAVVLGEDDRKICNKETMQKKGDVLGITKIDKVIVTVN